MSRTRDLTSDKWSILSRALYMLETWFVGSRKSMTCEPDTCPWRVTLYIKVTWPHRWSFSSRALCMLQKWICLCFHNFFGQGSEWHVSQMRNFDAWPLYVKVAWPHKWPILSRALYMLETWMFVVSTVRWVQDVNVIRDLDAWPCRSRSHVEVTYQYNQTWNDDIKKWTVTWNLTIKSWKLTKWH